MRISNILERIAKSKTGQKFYKWACEPKSEEFLNRQLPAAETVLSTMVYTWSTEKQKNIERDQKNLLHIQNIGAAVVGLSVASKLNKKVGKFGEDVIKGLDTSKIDPKSIRQISTGIRVGIPIICVAMTMRFLLPSILAGISGKMMDKVRERKKLDTQA